MSNKFLSKPGLLPSSTLLSLAPHVCYLGTFRGALFVFVSSNMFVSCFLSQIKFAPSCTQTLYIGRYFLLMLSVNTYIIFTLITQMTIIVKTLCLLPQLIRGRRRPSRKHRPRKEKIWHIVCDPGRECRSALLLDLREDEGG